VASTEGETAYFIKPITAETTDAVMTTEGDRYEVVIPLQTAHASSDGREIDGVTTGPTTPGSGAGAYDNTELDLLDESGNVELTITTESGSQRFVTLSVPDSLVGDGGGTVQL
jgi:flagellin FlaB